MAPIKTVNIKIADYASYPAGRTVDDGEFNAERFRQDVLMPAYLKACERGVPLEVEIGGISLSASFLEEAFGGLVRKEGIDHQDLARRLKVIIKKPSEGRYAVAIERILDPDSCFSTGLEEAGLTRS